MPAPLHVGQGDMLTPEAQVELVVRELHLYALVAGRDNPLQVFCLLLTGLQDFVMRTDAAVDLLNMAIDLLLEQRSEVIAAAKAAAAGVPS